MAVRVLSVDPDGSIYYLALDLASRQARIPENTPNLANLPKNMGKRIHI